MALNKRHWKSNTQRCKGSAACAIRDSKAGETRPTGRNRRVHAGMCRLRWTLVSVAIRFHAYSTPKRRRQLPASHFGHCAEENRPAALPSLEILGLSLSFWCTASREQVCTFAWSSEICRLIGELLLCRVAAYDSPPVRRLHRNYCVISPRNGGTCCVIQHCSFRGTLK